MAEKLSKDFLMTFSQKRATPCRCGATDFAVERLGPLEATNPRTTKPTGGRDFLTVTCKGCGLVDFFDERFA